MQRKKTINDTLNTPQEGLSTRLNDDNAALQVALEFKEVMREELKCCKTKASLYVVTLRADKIRMFRDKKRLQKQIGRLKKVHESLTPKTRTKEEIKGLNITSRT
jgi:hypothetical protein